MTTERDDMERGAWHSTREIGRVQYALSRGVLALGVPLLSSGIIYQLFFTSENIWAFLGFLVPMIPGTLWFGFRFGAKQWDANERRCSKTGPSLLELPDPPRPDRLIAACGKVSLVIGIILGASFAITYAFTAAAQDADMANNLKLRAVGGYVVLGNLFVSIVAAVIGAVPLFAPIKPKETAKIATTLNTAISIVVIILFVTRYNRDTADIAQESLAYSESASAAPPIPQEATPTLMPPPSPSPTPEQAVDLPPDQLSRVQGLSVNDTGGLVTIHNDSDFRLMSVDFAINLYSASGAYLNSYHFHATTQSPCEPHSQGGFLFTPFDNAQVMSVFRDRYPTENWNIVSASGIKP